jgi:hypothetical protein
MSSTSGRSSVVLNFNAAGFDARRNFEAGSGLVGIVLLRIEIALRADLQGRSTLTFSDRE